MTTISVSASSSSVDSEKVLINDDINQQIIEYDYQLPSALMFQHHDPAPDFQYMVSDVSTPDIFIDQESLIHLEGNEIWDDQRNLTNWLASEDNNSIFLQYHVESGLTEWTMYELLAKQNVQTNKISCLRDKTHLFMAGQMILQWESNHDAVSAANILLGLKSQCNVRFRVYRVTQAFDFPWGYSFRPLQYSLDDTHFTNLELPVLQCNYVWFARPLFFNPKYYTIPVPGSVLGEQLGFEWDIFYYYDIDRKRFLYCMPNGRKVNVASLGNFSQRYHYKQHCMQNSTRRFYEITIFDPEISEYIPRLPSHVNVELLRYIVQDQSRKTYVAFNYLSPLAKKIAHQRMRAVQNISIS